MISVVLIVDNDKDEKRFRTAELSVEPYVTILNTSYRDDKKKAYEFMTEYGARQIPFAVINHEIDTCVAFWSESSKDVIGDLINYLS